MFVTRTDWVDWYVDGDESAVLVGGNVVVLSQLATALVGAVGAGGSSVTALTDTLIGEFGEPEVGGALAATEVAIADLVDAGVLTAGDETP